MEVAVFWAWLSNFEAMDWAFIGLLLIILEGLLPAGKAIWPGLAALLVSLISSLSPISPIIQLIVFALLTPTLTYWGRRLYKPSVNTQLSTQSRAFHFGQAAILLQDSKKQRGVVQIGKQQWPVLLQSSEGQDWPRGTQVEVVGQQSHTLLVIVNSH